MGRRVEVAPHARQDAEDALKVRRSELRRLILSRVDYERAEPVLLRHGAGHLARSRTLEDQVAIYEAAARELGLDAGEAR